MSSHIGLVSLCWSTNHWAVKFLMEGVMTTFRSYGCQHYLSATLAWMPLLKWLRMEFAGMDM